MNENLTETAVEIPTESVAEPTAQPVQETFAANPFFAETSASNNGPAKLPVHVPSLVMGILSLAFCLLIALAGEILGVIGISLAASKKKEFNVTAGMICSIVGLVLAIINHVLGILMMMGA